jgi:hypothetical protein
MDNEENASAMICERKLLEKKTNENVRRDGLSLRLMMGCILVPFSVAARRGYMRMLR